MFKFMFPRLILNIERWKWSKEYHCYVSTTGRIRDERKHIISLCKNEGGYPVYFTPEKGYRTVHRIVAETFMPVGGMKCLTIDHIDGNKNNNKLSNLQWVSAQENQKRANDKLVKNSQIKNAESISNYPVKFFIINDKMVSIHYLEETFRDEIKLSGMCDNDFSMKNVIGAYLRLAHRHYDQKEDSPIGSYYGQRIALKF